ncbi:MAG: hypothetical protein ABI042_11165 [Verrucomicrobiota bacterium]
MKLFIITVMGLVLAGCVSPGSRGVWYQEGRTDAQIEADFHACQYDVKKYGYVPPQNSSYTGGLGGAAGSGAADGITRAFEQADRKNEIISACMKSKGYRLISRKEVEAMGGTVRTSK